MRLLPRLLVLLAVCITAGCATSFPVARDDATFEDGATARQVFDACLAAHGGDIRTHDGDFNLSMQGRWAFLIQRIQPLVTDSGFRIRSHERFRPRDGIYVLQQEGPDGVKRIVQTPDGLRVSYNGVAETDPQKLSATAMTTDAFQLFHYGPSFIQWRASSMVRLPDAREGGIAYRRVLATLRPGFGDAKEDEVVLWIDPRDSHLFRVHMTLNGFSTTQGAHVDTTFLEYRRFGRYLLPVKFHERVRGPLRIDAHHWELTGLDLDRGWKASDVTGDAFTGTAAAPAKPL